MRIQFATLEVIISLLIVLSVVAYFEAYFVQVPNQYYHARETLAASMAEYDIMNNAMRNLSTAMCLSMYLTENSDCIKTLIYGYGLLYGIHNLSVSDGSKLPGGSNSPTGCFPYPVNGLLYTLCFDGG